MNTKKIIIIAIVLGLLLIGGYYLSPKNSQQSITGMNHGEMGGKAVVQSHRTYTFHLNSDIIVFPKNTPVQIKYSITDETGAVVKDFALDHTKLMHFILVRKDLQDFQHVHPNFNTATGEFSQTVTFPEDGKYRLFADFTPADGQKDAQGNILSATPYEDIQIGSGEAMTSLTVDTQTTKTVGDFEIAYTVPQDIQVGKEAIIKLHVTKQGQPVTDMEQYLGAQAHGILLRQNTLDFAHLHAMGKSNSNANGNNMEMQMNNGTMKVDNTGPDITFTYTFPQTGTYKLFTQFQEQGKVITTDYTFTVK